MYPIMKYVDHGLTLVGKTLFNSIQFFNKYKPAPAFTPKWSEKPLLKSWQKTKPTLGWPRTTDSLCPMCVREARSKILSGEQDYRTLINEHVGEIKADIIERNGQVWMVKECPRTWKNSKTSWRSIRSSSNTSKELFRVVILMRTTTRTLHNHGSSSIRHGRGSVLTVDLDKPLQHDVRSMLHGCQSGRICS